MSAASTPAIASLSCFFTTAKVLPLFLAFSCSPMQRMGCRPQAKAAWSFFLGLATIATLYGRFALLISFPGLEEIWPLRPYLIEPLTPTDIQGLGLGLLGIGLVLAARRWRGVAPMAVRRR